MYNPKPSKATPSTINPVSTHLIIIQRTTDQQGVSEVEGPEVKVDLKLAYLEQDSLRFQAAIVAAGA